MAENRSDLELEKLQQQIELLEQQKDSSEKAAAAQSRRLEQSLEELRDRAEQLTRSEEALRRQTRILQAILRSMGAGVIVAHDTGKFLLFNPAAEQILGIGAADLSPAEWSRHYGCFLPDRVTPFPPDRLPLSRAIHGEDVEETEVFIRNERRPQGIWLCVTARPLRDEFGIVRGGLSVFRDITEEKLAERRLAAQHAVTRALAESMTLGAATPKILQAICDSAGWEVGALWQVDRHENVLRCVDVWHRPDFAGQEFEDVTRRMAFSADTGLPGKVWAQREPIWIGDFAGHAEMPRREIAEKAGLHGAFAFPILFTREVTGVIEFLGKEMAKPDPALLSMISALGSQIGQFIERKRAEEEQRLAEEAVRNSEALYHSLVETLPLNVFRKDLQGRFIVANQLFCRTVGKPLEEILGKTDYDFYPSHLAEKYRQDDRRVIRQRQVFDLTEEHCKPDGQKLYVQVL